MIAHRAGIFNIEDEPVRRGFSNVHSVDAFARKVIDLFKVECIAYLQFIECKVSAAPRHRLRAGQSVGVHD